MSLAVKLIQIGAAGALALAVSACGNSDDVGPGGVTPQEAEMLDKAAEMLDEKQPDFSQNPDQVLADDVAAKDPESDN